MSNPDKDLEDYLNGDSEVSSTYRSTMDMQPPSSLDNTILRESRKAVKKPGFLSWLRMGESESLVPALSFAALAVLAFSIVLYYQSGSIPGSGNPSIITNKGDSKKSDPTNVDTSKIQPVNNSKKINSKSVPQPMSHSVPVKRDGDYKKSAESWTKHINELKASGKDTEAQKSLEEFKAAFPNHTPTVK